MKNKSIEIFETIMHSVMKYFKWVVVGSVALIVLTGVYKVDSNEVAVVLRFGKLVGTTTEEQIKDPGLHLAFPYIIDEVIKVPVETVQEITVETHYSADTAINRNIKTGGYVITGDSNLVLIRSVVKYKVSDPVRYALYINEINEMVTGVVSGETVPLVTSMPVDSVLTTEKTKLSGDLKKNVQEVLNELDCGITITNIELTNVIPPNETKDAFDAVNTASVKKQTLIQEANDYTESKIPKAQADSDSLVSEAKKNQSEKIAKANDEVAEFNGLYEQYKANPEVVKNGVFRSRVSKVLKDAGATIIVPDGEEGAKVILP
ncbi:MAG: FtsH protease activity modulator HflK [Ruminococcaceae bacterium]|nr:FtsH protease activity modulator HflK [Oscillospiraceae bacterium]